MIACDPYLKPIYRIILAVSAEHPAITSFDHSLEQERVKQKSNGLLVLQEKRTGLMCQSADQLTLADSRAVPGRAVMSRAMPRLALQAARAGAALRGPSTGSALPFLEGGRIVADAVLGTDPAAQPYKPHHQQHQTRTQMRKQLGI